LAHKLRAYLELKEGRSDQAIKDMEFYLRYFPDDIPFRYELGQFLVKEGRSKEALLHFQKVEELQRGY
jgi:tetratricopeptide (TPR) repeat protein